VFIGSLLGDTSPVVTHSPLVGAELRLEGGVTLTIDVPSSFEHGVLVDTGAITLEGDPVDRNELGYVGPGHESLTIVAREDTRLLLLGGEPFGEQIVMWWNFIGRDHDEIVGYREQWQSLLATGDVERFSLPEADPRGPLDAPPLPNARLRPRT